LFSSATVRKIFQMDARYKSRQTLLNAEEKGKIPKAERISRGSTKVRQWSLEQMPKIGEMFGFLKPPSKQQIICCYTTKGGVLKTTLALTLGRLLAINGIKTIIVGLDVQCSITDILAPPKKVESLNNFVGPHVGLYHYLYDRAPLKEIILDTNIPTLSIIPETPELTILDKKLRLEPRREYILEDKLISKLGKYDVVIFDNSPSWNQLIEGALTSSNVVLSPVGCDIGTYQALKTNLNSLYEFHDAMKINWEHFYLIPTLLEKTKLSQQIYAAYLNSHEEIVLSTPIRRAIKGQEAAVLSQSIIELDPSSPLSQDYFDLIKNIWGKITNTIEEPSHNSINEEKVVGA